MKQPKIEFSVSGVPAPQGSKIRTQFGMREASKRLAPWRKLVTTEAQIAMGNKKMLEGSIEMEIIFRFDRPKSHYRTGKNSYLLKDSSPRDHISKPDIDKLARAVLDGVTGVVFQDDSQVCCLRLFKTYGNPGATVKAYLF